MTECFGNLTKKTVQNTDDIISSPNDIDYLFQNSQKTLEKISAAKAERQIALDNLRNLTSILRTKRLRYNARRSCKYFTL